jgi:hypothetical protein
MKKLLLLSVLLPCSLLMTPVYSQTNVSGFINANTNWTLAGSPYMITGNTLLVHGYTLTIDPGVVIMFNPQKALQIDGELIAVGTLANRIVFTSAQAIPARGDWAKIQFSDTAQDAQFDVAGNYLSGCIMKYCDVLYGGSSSYGAVQIEGSAVCFEFCRIYYSGLDGIYCHGFAKIKSCEVSYNTQKGIYLSITGSPYCPYIFEWNTIEHNDNGGLIFSEIPNIACGNASIIIRKNYFNANDALPALSNISTLRNDLLIKENNFTNNSPASLNGVVNLYKVDSNVVIECNHFTSNTGFYPVVVRLDEGHGDTIRNNFFYGNTCSTCHPYSSLVYIYKYCCYNISISNNVFRDNIMTDAMLLRLAGGASGNDITKFDVHNNNFIDNTANSGIFLSTSLASTTLQFADIANNNFLDPNVQYEINDYASFGAPNVDADSNYWGTTITQHVDSAIYDYFDDSNYSIVYYSPVLSSAAPVDTTCPKFLPTEITDVKQKPGEFVIYPNPTHDTFTISLNQRTVDNGQLTVFDIAGRCVYFNTITNSQSSIINENFSPGVYFVKVSNGERSETKKLIIQ